MKHVLIFLPELTSMLSSALASSHGRWMQDWVGAMIEKAGSLLSSHYKILYPLLNSSAITAFICDRGRIITRGLRHWRVLGEYNEEECTDLEEVILVVELANYFRRTPELTTGYCYCGWKSVLYGNGDSDLEKNAERPDSRMLAHNLVWTAFKVCSIWTVVAGLLCSTEEEERHKTIFVHCYGLVGGENRNDRRYRGYGTQTWTIQSLRVNNSEAISTDTKKSECRLTTANDAFTTRVPITFSGLVSIGPQRLLSRESICFPMKC
ncbi:uncharacterized protein BDR25DRAFT_392807 [Lindgomyces ingoldianus]|uniref:Uncharacterized protein n=1 Tax=Lindgomyces ingoldianus TaxID=673940 RepID=A0ACB6QZD3_9PLEO|nr:uncharacterized protein BDR25DRAFT_392807 [Lindgomyces ingoldianus]KAF2472349.1 hypothetical protein BDR25DRAFT_392807 [Lindgomyces ingoldianus]